MGLLPLVIQIVVSLAINLPSWAHASAYDRSSHNYISGNIGSAVKH